MQTLKKTENMYAVLVVSLSERIAVAVKVRATLHNVKFLFPRIPLRRLIFLGTIRFYALIGEAKNKAAVRERCVCHEA